MTFSTFIHDSKLEIYVSIIIEFNTMVRDAIIKENPVKSGFLQIGGVGDLGPTDPDFYM